MGKRRRLTSRMALTRPGSGSDTSGSVSGDGAGSDNFSVDDRRGAPSSSDSGHSSPRLIGLSLGSDTGTAASTPSRSSSSNPPASSSASSCRHTRSPVGSDAAASSASSASSASASGSGSGSASDGSWSSLADVAGTKPINHIDSPNSFPAEVLDYLFVGSHIQAANTENVDFMEITHLLSVGSAYDVAPNYKRFIHRFIPLSDYGLDDHTDPKIQECLAFVREARASGGRILVHCRIGVNRSPTICLLHLMLDRGMTLKEAEAKVSLRRPVMDPHEVTLRMLRDLDADLARRRRRGTSATSGSWSSGSSDSGGSLDVGASSSASVAHGRLVSNDTSDESWRLDGGWESVVDSGSSADAEIESLRATSDRGSGGGHGSDYSYSYSWGDRGGWGRGTPVQVAVSRSPSPAFLSMAASYTSLSSPRWGSASRTPSPRFDGLI